MSDPIRLVRKVNPLKFTGVERTYFEVVPVKDGVATCRNQSTVKILRTRGYEYLDQEAPKGALQPESAESSRKPPQEGGELSGNPEGQKKAGVRRSIRGKARRTV